MSLIPRDSAESEPVHIRRPGLDRTWCGRLLVGMTRFPDVEVTDAARCGECLELEAAWSDDFASHPDLL